MPWPPKDGAPWNRSGHPPEGAKPVGPSVHGDHPLDRTPEGELLRRLLVVLDKHGITDFDCPDSLDALLTKRLGERDSKPEKSERQAEAIALLVSLGHRVEFEDVNGSAAVWKSDAGTAVWDYDEEPQVGDVEAYLAMVKRARGTTLGGDD